MMVLYRRSCLLGLLAMTGCVRPPGRTAWNGRRGYDGNGDYGYDPDAPREARAFEGRARSSYPAPGPPSDPWGPYVTEAAARFRLPQDWIRAVMRQESGGRTNAADGTPIVSVAGAMGLMQVMPGTYDILRRKYGLGSDPFSPRDNILAGTAYLKEMHGKFGAPGFLAAYNAGPDRVSAYLAGATMLPDETVNYVAAIGPRIGMAGSFGPGGYGGGYGGGGAVYAGGGGGVYGGSAALPDAALASPTDPRDQAYAGGGMTGVAYFGRR